MEYKREPRDTDLSRPVIASAEVMSSTNAPERFQNTVLRPIIKMQHDLLLMYYRQYLDHKAIDFASWSSERQTEFINQSLSRDLQLKNQLNGMIIGHFTTSEYQAYKLISQEINKRIISIIKERLMTHLDAFAD